MNLFYIVFLLYISSTLTMQHPDEYWETIKKISFHGPTSCVYDKDNKFVIGLTNYNSITQHYFGSRPVSICFEYKTSIAQITLSPAQKYLYGVSSKDPHCTKRLYTLWSLATKKILHQLELSNFYYHISHHDRYLITQDKGTIQVRDVQTSTILHTITPIHNDITKLIDPYLAPSFNHNETLLAIAHKSPNGQAVCDADKSRIIYLPTGKIRDIYGSQCCPAFSPTGRYIATATKDNMVTLWDINKSWQKIAIIKCTAHALLFKKDNRLIIKNLPIKKDLIEFLEKDTPLTDAAFPSLIIANPTAPIQQPRQYNNSICSSGGSTLCTLNHYHKYNAQKLCHVFICTFLNSDTAIENTISCDIRKLYPAPLYMSPQGQYIVIPSYEYDLIANARQKTYVYHPGGRYGNMHFSDNETTIAYQADQQTVVLLKKQTN